MAELDATTIITFVLLVVLAVAVYYEIRFIRSRKKKGPDTSSIDDTYNQIITTRAVSQNLKKKGNDTKDADLLVIEAEAAYDRGNYAAARNSIDRAKVALQHVKPLPNAIEEEPKHPIKETAFERSGPDAPYIEPSYEVPFQKAKLPKDYIESKFMICSVRDDVARMKAEGSDVSQIESSLDQAQQLFDQQKYTDSLRFAMKAKHALEEPSPPVARPPAHERMPEAAPEKKIEYCKKCNALIDEGDTFCRRCGAKVERIPHCPSCGAEAAGDDVFCRKCGNQLRSLFTCPVCNAEVGEADERCPKCRTPLG